MREKLIELLRADVETHCDKYDGCEGCPYEHDVSGCLNYLVTVTADHLLANDVIVQPCKVGDVVYTICGDGSVMDCVVDEIETTVTVCTPYNTMRLPVEAFARYCHLTREEAEAALREVQG